MQRGVGQDQAELPVPRCYGAGHLPARAARRSASSTIGRRALVEQRLARLIQLAQAPGRGQVGHHDGERLVLAVLGRAQRRRCLAPRSAARPGGSRRAP